MAYIGQCGINMAYMYMYILAGGMVMWYNNTLVSGVVIRITMVNEVVLCHNTNTVLLLLPTLCYCS